MKSTERRTLTKRARTSRAIALTLSIGGLVASGAAVTSAGAATKKTEISTTTSATLGTYLVSGGPNALHVEFEEMRRRLPQGVAGPLSWLRGLRKQLLAWA